MENIAHEHLDRVNNRLEEIIRDLESQEQQDVTLLNALTEVGVELTTIIEEMEQRRYDFDLSFTTDGEHITTILISGTIKDVDALGAILANHPDIWCGNDIQIVPTDPHGFPGWPVK